MNMYVQCMCVDCGLDTVVVKLLLKDRKDTVHLQCIVPPHLLGYGLLGSYGFG